MRYLIMGAGALGSVIGGLLHHSGQSVAFIGRGPHFDCLRTRGLSIDGIWGEFSLGPMAAFEVTPTTPGNYDVILLCVKSFDTREACRRVKDLPAPEGLIISLQNGLGNLEVIAQEFGAARTVGARVIFGARISRPGLVTVTVYADRVLLGGMAPATTGEKLAQVAADLNQAGIPSAVVEDIISPLWNKVLYNCALNPLGAILAAPYGALGENRETRELMRLVITEIYRVGQAQGITLHPPDAASYFQHFLDHLVPATAPHWPSMWQDLQHGRRTEIEALNGAICRYGAAVGVATPYNDAVCRLMRFLEGKLHPEPRRGLVSAED